MNGLSHRIFREFRAHFGRYLALFLMIMLGMYLVVSVAGMAERTIEGSDHYNEECKLQDGLFTTFVPLKDAAFDYLENEYGTIERQGEKKQEQRRRGDSGVQKPDIPGSGKT